MGRILIGISSWSDKTLATSGFYPAEVKTPADRLGYYSRMFPVAEIDSSYHYFPTRRNLDLWLDNTPPGFAFDVKAFSLFTGHPTPPSSLPRALRDRLGDRIKPGANLYPHHLPPEALDELWQGFAGTLHTIRAAGRLGVVLFQFPPWFHPGEQNFDYVARCRERLPEYRLAVEFRVESWLGDRDRETTLSFLRKHGLILVCVDEPQGFRSSLAPLAEVTASTGFVRFHGRNRDTWEAKAVLPDDKFKYLYSEAELAEWVPRIRDMAANTSELHVIFKNKHSDFPVTNAHQLQRMLGT